VPDPVVETPSDAPVEIPISGRLASLPIVLNLEFTYDTNILKKSIEINDKPLYGIKYLTFLD
jgi:hypothetical protein